MMPVKRTNRSHVSMKQLMDVFKLCDPENSGEVNIEYLLELAKAYAKDGSDQDLGLIFNQLDSSGKGTLSFKEFSSGVRLMLRQNQLQEKIMVSRESMMSPVTTATESATLGGAGSADSRFILSPPTSPRPSDAVSKSQCSSLSDGDNYECFEHEGEGETPDNDADSGIAADRPSNDGIRSPSGNAAINRHTWLRTSLRRTQSNHSDNLPNRRWGSFRHAGKRQQQITSNALASQLYRSSSFNSSGRSSNCDTADDMYSDASLEEDVLDLNHKVQLLQQQMGVLQDSATHNDERYTRAKADNAALQARVIMLEEQLRDAEMRADERIHDEQRRTKELIARLDREKVLQLENSSIRQHAAETEANTHKDEAQRQRVRVEKLENERKELSDQLLDFRHEISLLKEDEHKYKEQERRLIKANEAQSQLIEELSREVERLRAEVRTPALPTTSPEALRLDELHEEMASLRELNQQLQDSNEELQASILHAGVEKGRQLTAGLSLAAELDEMTHDEMQHALKEQQDVNSQLRSYIDGILLNIVEKCPQLLEVNRRSV
ncbi:rab11 family-interacting protein 4B isoform X3 [Atheta coriaria]|uniref:rab11 family-interacting protein 4B isoform X3 n=1 Tax=Dalotia coriaria TaxID=877792 RepID=UPI0031F43B37